MAANNETGVIFPMARLSAAVKEKYPNILFHTDATNTSENCQLTSIVILNMLI